MDTAPFAKTGTYLFIRKDKALMQDVLFRINSSPGCICAGLKYYDPASISRPSKNFPYTFKLFTLRPDLLKYKMLRQRLSATHKTV
jgi:hypothetical protein